MKSRVSFLASFNTVNKMLLLFPSITRSWDQWIQSIFPSFRSIPRVFFPSNIETIGQKFRYRRFKFVPLSLDKKKCRKGLKTRGRRSRWNELKARLARSTGGNGPAYGVIIFSTGRKGRWEARVLSHTLSLSLSKGRTRAKIEEGGERLNVLSSLCLSCVNTPGPGDACTHVCAPRYTRTVWRALARGTQLVSSRWKQKSTWKKR